MSLVIDPRSVTAVLLADDWHKIRKGSFVLDDFAFGYSKDKEDSPEERLARGAADFSGTRGSGPGFRFVLENGDYVSGPFTAVLAVRHEMSEFKFDPIHSTS
ncbi:MAG: hypothetical protein WBL53_03165 [Pseudonocardiaceae bacterium]|jgi:hypothetical protein